MAKNGGLINLSRQELCVEAEIPVGSWYHVMGVGFPEFIAEIRPEVGEDNPVPSVRKRANPNLRKDQILKVALDICEQKGYANLTREKIAEAAGVSPGTVSIHFGTMPQLKRAVMRSAIKNEVIPIVAEGLAAKDPHASKAPAEIKAKAATLIVNY